MKAQGNSIGRTAAALAVILAHLAILWWLTLNQVVRLPELQTPVFLTLEPPRFALPERQPPATPSPVAGGSSPAPSSPSIVHRPPETLPSPEPLPLAPEVPADVQPLVLDLQPGDSTARGNGVSAGSGRGVGNGTGDGTGDGDGAGRVAVYREAQLVQRPTPADIRRHYPREAWRARQTGQAVVSCVVRADRRLEACQVMYETPPEAGFGRAGLELATRYRFRPPTRDGRPVEGHRVTFAVEYVRP